MDVRLAVGGLISRDAVLRSLVLNYAERLEQPRPGSATTETTTAFIVPSWTDDDGRHAVGDILEVQAHIAGGGPAVHPYIDVILRLVHEVLTVDAASVSIRAQRLTRSGEILAGGHDTVYKTATWQITAAPRHGPEVPRRSPSWPPRRDLGSAGFVAPGVGTLSMN